MSPHDKNLELWTNCWKYKSSSAYNNRTTMEHVIQIQSLNLSNTFFSCTSTQSNYTVIKLTKTYKKTQAHKLEFSHSTVPNTNSSHQTKTMIKWNTIPRESYHQNLYEEPNFPLNSIYRFWIPAKSTCDTEVIGAYKSTTSQNAFWIFEIA